MNQLTLHIGLHKTGTSFLQYVLFPKIDGVEIYRGYSPVRRIMRMDPDKKIILSDESFSGDPLKSGYSEAFEKNIKRLKLLFGDPNIVLGIRNQQSLVLSIYKQYLQQKGYKSIEYLFNTQNTGILKHDDLLLYPRIKVLKENFSRVFTFDQKALLNKPDEFINALTKFLGVDNQIISLDENTHQSNKSIVSIKQVNYLRKLNKINAGLKHLNPNLGLYGGLFNSLNITPRDICQKRMNGKNSAPFQLPKELSGFLHEYYKADWNKVYNEIDFKLS